MLQIVRGTNPKTPKKEDQGAKMVGLKMDHTRGSAGSFILMMELRKKVFAFRDIVDLPPCGGSASINEVNNLYGIEFSI